MIEVVENKVLIGQMPSGAPIELTTVELDSQVEGPSFYIQSGMHGGEITQWIIHQLFEFLQTNLIKGKVILAPCANPVAWTQRAYFSTNGKFDFYMGKDWNRNFPGNIDGSLGERIAFAVFQRAKTADFVVYLHTSRNSIPFAIFTKKEYLPFVKMVGLKYNQFLDVEAYPAYQNTLNACLDKVGKPNLCIECGSHDAYEPQYVEKVFDGLKNLLAAKGMISGEHSSPALDKVCVFGRLKKYRAAQGGVVHFNKKPGDEVHLGDELFYLFDNNCLGRVVPEKAQQNGVVLKISPTHIYWSGDEVVQLIAKDDIESL